MRSSFIVSAAVIASVAVIHPAEAQAQSQPEQCSLLDEMAEAHGGRERWLEQPALKMHFSMHLNSLSPDLVEGRSCSDSWRLFETVIEPSTSRGYVDNLLADHAGPEAGFDGTRLWDSDVTHDPAFKDPAFMMLWYHYTMIAMPFLVAHPLVDATCEGQAPLLNESGTFEKVRVSYERAGWPGYLELYIDPETRLLKGWNQALRTPPLPGEPVPFLPVASATPTRVVDSYLSFDGFTIPRAYVSYAPSGNYTALHVLSEIERLDQFDSDAATPPDGVRITFDGAATDQSNQN